MLLNCGREDSCKSLGLQGDQSVNPKGHQPWGFTGRTDAKAEAPILWPPDAKSQLIGKDPDAGKDWRQEEKGTTEDETVEWHRWLNGHEFEQTLGESGRQRSLACCRPWGHKELDTTEQQSVGLLHVYAIYTHNISEQVSPNIPGEGNGYPLQYSGLENSMDCIVHAVTNCWTRLSDFHFFPLHLTWDLLSTSVQKKQERSSPCQWARKLTVVGEKCGQNWPPILALLTTSCVIWNKLLNFSEPQISPR